MKVIIDEREQALYECCESLLRGSKTVSYVQLSKDVLNLGDILIKTDEDKDVLLIERKTFADLLASIKDGRYEEQSYRLLNSSGFLPHSIIYLIEGVFSQLKNPLEKKIIQSSMTSMNYFKGFSTHRTSSVNDTAVWLLYMADKIEKNFLKGIVPYYLTQPFNNYFSNKKNEEIGEPNNEDNNIVENRINIEENNNLTSADYCRVVKKVKKDNITPENIGEIILCQIPGISSITAIAIMKHFENFTDFIQKIAIDFSCIENLTIESNGKTRKISKKSVESIRNYLLNQYES